MRVRLTRSDDERGAVAAITAALLVPLLITCAFVLDFGNTYAQARAFSTGADSGALSVANMFRQALQRDPMAYSAGGDRASCADLVAYGQTDADEAARAAVRANHPFAVSIPDPAIKTELSCVDGSLRVQVVVTQSVPTTLGQMVGVDSIKADKSATAGLTTAAQVGGVSRSRCASSRPKQSPRRQRRNRTTPTRSSSA